MPNQGPPARELFSEFVQIGAVVEDIDRSMKTLLEVFGVGPWRVISWPPEGRTDMDRVYQGRLADFTARMAFAELGPIEIELIQPLTGDSIWADYLAEHGPGLHHIRFNVPEMEPVVEHVAEHGIGVTQRANGIRPGTSWVNFDTERLVGFTVEVMRPVPGTSGRTPALMDGQVVG